MMLMMIGSDVPTIDKKVPCSLYFMISLSLGWLFHVKRKEYGA